MVGPNCWAGWLPRACVTRVFESLEKDYEGGDVRGEIEGVSECVGMVTFFLQSTRPPFIYPPYPPPSFTPPVPGSELCQHSLILMHTPAHRVTLTMWSHLQAPGALAFRCNLDPPPTLYLADASLQAQNPGAGPGRDPSAQQPGRLCPPRLLLPGVLQQSGAHGRCAAASPPGSLPGEGRAALRSRCLHRLPEGAVSTGSVRRRH